MEKINVLQSVLLLLLASFQQDYVPWNAIGGLNINENQNLFLTLRKRFPYSVINQIQYQVWKTKERVMEYVRCKYKDSEFLLEKQGSEYGICGLDSSGEDLWFPDNYKNNRILPFVTLNACSVTVLRNSQSRGNLKKIIASPDGVVNVRHSFENVKRIHIPAWMSHLEAHNYLFPALEEVIVDPDNKYYLSCGPLLFERITQNREIKKELVRVFSAGYMDKYTIPKGVVKVGEWALAYTRITDIDFEEPCVAFDANALKESQIEQLIIKKTNNKEQFITFGNILYHCAYINSKILKIPDHILSFNKGVFAGTYQFTPTGGKDRTGIFMTEEIESPIPIPSHCQSNFSQVTRYSVHAFNHYDNNDTIRRFPKLKYFSILYDETVAGYETDCITVDGVLFSKDMKSLIYYPPKRPGDTYTAPNGVERICSFAFESGCELHHIQFPPTLKHIAARALVLSSIQEIELPQSVESVGYDALCNIPIIRCYEGTAKGLIKSLGINSSSTIENIQLEIIRTDGSKMRVFLPNCLKVEGISYLSDAWNEPKFDFTKYVKCYSYFTQSLLKYRFLCSIYREYGDDTEYAQFFRRIAMNYAKQLIELEKQEELIELLEIRVFRPQALKNLLKLVGNKNLPVVTSYILQCLSETGKRGKSLRL